MYPPTATCCWRMPLVSNRPSACLECTKKAEHGRAAYVRGHLRSRADHLRSRAGHPRCSGLIKKSHLPVFYFIHPRESLVHLSTAVGVRLKSHTAALWNSWLKLSGYLAAPARNMYFYRARAAWDMYLRLSCYNQIAISSFMVNWILWRWHFRARAFSVVAFELSLLASSLFSQFCCEANCVSFDVISVAGNTFRVWRAAVSLI